SMRSEGDVTTSARSYASGEGSSRLPVRRELDSSSEGRYFRRTMRDDDEEIREIKKEIIESRGLIIKTSNLVNSLSADIKAIAKRQASYERRFNMNSAVVYVLVAGLSFAGLKLASDARISEVESQKSALESQLEELRNDVAEESRRAEDRSRAEIEAGRYYDLIRAGKREQVVEQYEAITKL